MKTCFALIINVLVIQLGVLMTSCSNDGRIDLGHGVFAERISTEHGDRFGILYGDSIISGHCYSRIELPDSIDDIVFLYKMNDGSDYCSYGYAVLDLSKRRYIYLETGNFPIDTIISIDRFNYALYNDAGRHFTTLKLTENGDNGYNAELVPFFSNAAVTVADFIRVGERVLEEPQDDEYLKEMYDKNRSAYRLLEYVFNMWGEEGSPTNDLNFARAMRYFIARDYGGDEARALAELNSIFEILGCATSTQHLTFCMSIDRCLASMQLSWEYERIMMDYPLYEAEYVAWHNMIGAIVNYMDFLFYKMNWYQCKCMDDEETKMDIFEERREWLKNERNILAGNTNYVAVGDTLKTVADIESILELYYEPEAPECYHPIWYEIRPAVKEWLSTRKSIASSLPAGRAKSFGELNRELIDGLYYRIKSLDYWGMRPPGISD